MPEKKDNDDNSGFQQDLGHGEIEFSRFIGDNHLRVKLIPGTKRFGSEISYNMPYKKGLRSFTKFRSGTGLSLQDYDHESHKIAFGFSLTDTITSKDL